MNRLRLNLNRKFLLSIALLQLVLLTVALYGFRLTTAIYSEEELAKRHESTLQILSTLAKDSVLSYDLATLGVYADEVIRQPDMMYLEIIDQNGAQLVERGSLLSENESHIAISQQDIIEGSTYFGSVTLAIDRQFMIKRLQVSTRNAFLVFLLFFIFSCQSAYWLSSYITRSLTRLREGATQLASGHLSYRLNSSGNDELSDVCEGFNTMAAELSKLYNNLDQEVGLNQAMFMTSPSAIIICNSTGIILNYNSAAQKVFGYAADDAIDQNISKLMSDASAKAHGDYFLQVKENGLSQEFIRGREIIGRDSKGNEINLHITISQMTMYGDIRFVIMLADISDRKAAEKALSQYQDTLEQTVKQRTEQLEAAKDAAEAGMRSKSAFIANMSHEIRTPMNSIIGFSEVLLSNKELPETAIKQIKTVLNSSRSLLTIINDILDISKFESGKFELESVRFHLANAVSFALKTVEQQALEKGLRINLIIHPSLPSIIEGDPTRLRQVILNIVSNAIKFTHEGKIEVSVAQGDADNLIEISVSDTGIGMSEQQSKQVFEPFTQADSSTTRKYGGTGLGTSISRQIVNLMGGKIWVKSSPGEGSCFRFTFIAPDATDMEGDCLFENDDILSQDYRSPRLFNILLAEDIETNAILATLRLERQGHRVNWVKNGYEALATAEKELFDVILMDVMMPVMDGVEATQKIRLLKDPVHAATPILALTASVMREDHERCREAGMQRVVAKPIDFNALLTSMEDIVSPEKGTPNSNLPEQYREGPTVNFEPIMACINVDNALNVWQDHRIYQKALLNFASEHRGVAQKIKGLLDQYPNDNFPARSVAHTVKGLSGNLSINDVANSAILIDDFLKENDRKTAIEQCDSLHKHLQIACDAIKALEHSAQGVSTEQIVDDTELHVTLSELRAEVSNYNPDGMVPLINTLKGRIPEKTWIHLNASVEKFDFETVERLIDELGSLTKDGRTSNSE